MVAKMWSQGLLEEKVDMKKNDNKFLATVFIIGIGLVASILIIGIYAPSSHMVGDYDNGIRPDKKVQETSVVFHQEMVAEETAPNQTNATEDVSVIVTGQKGNFVFGDTTSNMTGVIPEVQIRELIEAQRRLAADRK